MYRNYIAKAKSYGYSVNVHFVDLDRNKALGRLLERFITTGRFLEPELVEKYAPLGRNKIEETYEKLKREGVLDGFSKWDNDVKYGESAKLIECKGDSVRFCYSKDGRTERNNDGGIQHFFGGKRDRIDGTFANREIGNSERSGRQEGNGYGLFQSGGRNGEETDSLLGGQQGNVGEFAAGGKIQKCSELQNVDREQLKRDIMAMSASIKYDMDMSDIVCLNDIIDNSDIGNNKINVVGFSDDTILVIDDDAEIGFRRDLQKPSDIRDMLLDYKNKGFDVAYHYVDTEKMFSKPLTEGKSTEIVYNLCKYMNLTDSCSITSMENGIINKSTHNQDSIMQVLNNKKI